MNEILGISELNLFSLSISGSSNTKFSIRKIVQASSFSYLYLILQRDF